MSMWNEGGCTCFTLDHYPPYHPPSPRALTWLARRDIAEDFEREIDFALWKFPKDDVHRHLKLHTQDFLVRLEATATHIASGVEPEGAIDRITPKVGFCFVSVLYWDRRKLNFPGRAAI